jgi:translocation and assembly module TamB
MRYLRSSITFLFLSFLSLLLGALFLLSLFFATLQTDYGKEKAKVLFISLAKKQNTKLQIDTIKGQLPFRWKLLGVRCQYKDTATLKADYVKVKIGFFSLIKGTFYLKSFKVFHLQFLHPDYSPSPLITLRGRAKIYSTIPRFRLRALAILEEDPTTHCNLILATSSKAKIQGKIAFYTDHLETLAPYFKTQIFGKASLTSQIKGGLFGPYQLDKLDVITPYFQLHGKTSLTSPSQIKQAHLTFASDYLVGLKGTLNLEKNVLNIEAQADKFQILQQPFSHATFSLIANIASEVWQGSINTQFFGSSLPLSLKSILQIEPWHKIELKDLYFLAPDSEMGGKLSLSLSSQSLEGSLFAQSKDLSHFKKVFALSSLQGQLGTEITFSSDPFQTVNLHLFVNRFQYDYMSGDSLDVKLQAYDLFTLPKGLASLEGKKLKMGLIELDDLSAETKSDNTLWPFEIRCSGNWKDHFKLKTKGDFSTCTLNINDLNGSLDDTTFYSEKPFSLKWCNDNFKLSECVINYPSGTLQLAMNFSKTFAQASLKADHIPLKLLFIPGYDLSFLGHATLDAKLEGTKEDMHGHLNLLLEEAKLFQFGKQGPLQAKGSIQANLANNILQIHSNFLSSLNQFFVTSASLPMEFPSLFPLRARCNKETPFSAQILFDGTLEDIFDFVNLGSQELKGSISSQFFLGGNLKTPQLRGSLDWHNGNYQNFRLGTSLNAIEAHLTANNQKIILDSLRARGPEGGDFSMNGIFNFDPESHFPYKFDAQLKDLKGIDFDIFSGRLTGPLLFHGDFNHLTISGKLQTSQADIKIPDKLPVDIPNVPFTFVNPPSGNDKKKRPASGFPVTFDIKVKGEDQIFVRGRGLNSQWQGKTRISGENGDFTAEGNLTLIKGEYLFSGQTFTLTKGEIFFSEEGAQINLSGNLTLPDVTITVVLSGPLKSPQLTFQSMPIMPTSAILSRIIFNKDISEISPFQAVQLAQIIVSLSGESGPNILEKIRSSLGVDRFNFVSSASHPDEISLQIGKYLMRGVMVTYSQSAHSNQIIVEVELKAGFIFQAETQEDEEGKFSLKWNLNY